MTHSPADAVAALYHCWQALRTIGAALENREQAQHLLDVCAEMVAYLEIVADEIVPRGPLEAGTVKKRYQVEGETQTSGEATERKRQ